MAIGPVTIITYNPVTITGLEQATNLYFAVRNDGPDDVTVHFTSLEEILQDKPGWIVHLFAFMEQGFGKPRTLSLNPGEEKTFEFMVANAPQDAEVDLPFRFRVEETGDEGLILLTLRSAANLNHPRSLPHTAAVMGRVLTADGRPVTSIEVKCILYHGGDEFTATTDAAGYYSIGLPSIEDLHAVMGPRPLPYRSLDYFLVVETDGYELAYRDGIAPLRGETLTVDLVLEPAVEAVSYRQIGELFTQGAHGYWWLSPDQEFSRFTAIQARHPPELDVPGHIVMTDLRGTELWRVPTGDECWGFDVAADGRVVAGCHDGNVYLTDAEGNLLWQVETGGLNREVRFSPDGGVVFTGPYSPEGERGPQFDAVLLDSVTGQVVWTYAGPGEWLRNSRFTLDGQRIIGGFGGQMVALSREGTPLWNAYIGEFPLTFDLDADNNLYVGGKSQELFSFDIDGSLRWRHRIPAGVPHAGLRTIPQDGSMIVFGTGNGWLHAYDTGTGDAIWKRKLLGSSGHNATDITPDGRWILVGAFNREDIGWVAWVALYNSKGTLVWSHKSVDSRDPGQFPYEFNHNHVGAITVAISNDGRHVAAGYGDSTIRIFERR